MKKNDEVKNIWNTNAAFLDSRMQEGNDFHKILIEPNQLDMLQIKNGDSILDIACGNGQFARKMAELGAKVIATDFSEEFIKIARSKTLSDKIDYRVIDVTDKRDLNKLKEYKFDSIVCTMAIMDIENIEPLISYLPKILKNNGKFVFSIMHPCFNSADVTLVQEHSDAANKPHRSYFLKITGNYLVSRKFKGWAMRGQPKTQYYFHRPLSEILNLCFKNGFLLNSIREPSFTREKTGSIWENVYKNTPAALVCGLILQK
ncbi:MAG: hypothetical protein A2137_00790 [Chloroflexi bacterium RBG_16_58_8]|nr:MAG: hypothetical protein A2137_00790 [Chloroflexi bacterium RBG_16_58_8]